MGGPARTTYMARLWELDPICRVTASAEPVRAFSLAALRDGGALSEPYGRYVDTLLGIKDELAILLPAADHACLALCLDRRGQPFSREEVEVACELQQLFAVLHQSHLAVTPPLGEGEADEAAELARFSRRHGLTARETDILALTLNGHANAAIAARLGITVGVVKNHKHRLYNKLDITTERELITTFFAARRAM